MGRAGKTRRAIERKKKKSARKLSNAAQYQAWKEAGTNTKSKRTVINRKKARRFRNIRHAFGKCGNIGCVKCSPLAQMLADRKRAKILGY